MSRLFTLLLVCRQLFRNAVLVAVGTLIAERPPHRSVRARLRIRLVPGMDGGKAVAASLSVDESRTSAVSHC
jgi:hypothetical protein